VEFGWRARRLAPEGAFEALATLVEAADYSAEGATGEQAEQAWARSEPITQVVHDQATRGQRVRWALDPRPIDRRRPRRGRRARSGSARGDAPAIELLLPG
jgi:hypothetical protein